MEPTEDAMTEDWLDSIPPDEASEWAFVIGSDAIANFTQHFIYTPPPGTSTPLRDSVGAGVPVTPMQQFEDGTILDLSDTNTIRSTTTSVSRPASPEIEQTPGFLERMNQSAANLMLQRREVHPVSSGESDEDDCQVLDSPVVPRKSRKLSGSPVTAAPPVTTSE